MKKILIILFLLPLSSFSKLKIEEIKAEEGKARTEAQLIDPLCTEFNCDRNVELTLLDENPEENAEIVSRWTTEVKGTEEVFESPDGNK